MSDLIEKTFSLSDYINSNNKPKQLEEESLLSDYIKSASEPIFDPLNYTDPELKKFMHTPVVRNQLQVAADYDTKAAELANSYMMAKKAGVSVSDLMDNYDEYSRHFLGDTDPVSGYQRIKDAYFEGMYGTKMGMLATEYMKKPVSEEGLAQFEKQLAMYESKMPPSYETSNVIMKAATGSAAQIYRQVASAEYLSPIPDIERRLREIEDNPEYESFAVGILRGMNDYITGYDTEKDRTAYVTKWQATLGSAALGQGITLANSLYYSELETGNTYLALRKIRTPDTVGRDGQVIPGEGLDESTMRALARIAGPIKGLSEAYFEKYALAKIPGLDRLFGSPKFITNTITDAAVKMGVKGALLKALQVSGAMQLGEISTELFQGSIDISANNLAIAMNDNRELMKDDIITTKEAIGIGVETFVDTFWTTAPTAFFGGSYSGIIQNINNNAYAKQEITEVVHDKIAISLESKEGFSTKAVQEMVREDPRMEKYSDRTLEKQASRVILERERGEDIGKDPTFTLKMFNDQMDETIKQAFIKEETGLVEGTPEFDEALAVWRKEHLDEFIAPLELTEEELRSRYEKDHADNEYDRITFERFVEQRRNEFAYSEAWSKTPDAQKYLATMDKAAGVINRIVEEDNLTPGVKDLLIKNQQKIKDLIESSKTKSPEGTPYVGTIEDFNVATKAEVKMLEDEITRLEELGRSYKGDKYSIAAVNEKLRGVIQAKAELESSNKQIQHILNVVSQNMFNENRNVNELIDRHERLLKRIEEYEDPNMQLFLSGKLDAEKSLVELEKLIAQSEDLEIDPALVEELDVARAGLVTLKDVLGEVYSEYAEGLDTPDYTEENAKVKISVADELSEQIPNVDRSLIEEVVQLFEYRANREGMSLKEFFDHWSDDTLTLDKSELGKTAAAMVVHNGYSGKMAFAFGDNTSLNTILHEVGHFFIGTLLQKDLDIYNKEILDMTKKRLTQFKLDYEEHFDNLPKEERADWLEYHKEYFTRIENALAGDVDAMNTEMGETWAIAFNEWATTDVTQNSGLVELFHKFTDFLSRIADLRGSDIRTDLDPKVAKFFDTLFSDKFIPNAEFLEAKKKYDIFESIYESKKENIETYLDRYKALNYAPKSAQFWAMRAGGIDKYYEEIEEKGLNPDIASFLLNIEIGSNHNETIRLAEKLSDKIGDQEALEVVRHYLGKNTLILRKLLEGVYYQKQDENVNKANNEGTQSVEESGIGSQKQQHNKYTK
ncbi:MAG: hypothetical protein ACTSYA_10535, partial [Candidatus Kariarchaeaceae archaeon]